MWKGWQGLSVIIDRTDINLEQRLPWLQLAKEKAGPFEGHFYGLKDLSQRLKTFLGPNSHGATMETEGIGSVSPPGHTHVTSGT